MIQITGENVTVDSMWQVAHDPTLQVGLAPEARSRMTASRDYIQKRIDQGEVIYGVNTGFGAFSSVRISPEDILKLQRNLIRSHSVGIGKPFTVAQTRAIMFARANALARGHSGIRPEVVEHILRCLNAQVIPVIPEQGSVGASGDLAPLSHLALALIGEGWVWQGSEKRRSAKVLKEKGIEPLVLQAKEGLALINGCQVMTAVGLLAAYQTRRLCWTMDVAGALSLEALRGTRKAFDPLIHATRPHPGEAKTGRNLLKLLGPTSSIAQSHDQCNKVQDAYSLRCMPAVHGAVKDTLARTLATLEIEVNSSTDNPLVFAEAGKVLSCGNFHGEPVAFALDFLAIAVTALAGISQCRIEKLINPAMSELPAFLAPNGGLNSGHMIVQVAAAALVSECKILSHPASVDSIPTSADKEDHVSMGTIAARKLTQIVSHAESINAMELLSGCQALDLLKPLEPSPALKVVYDDIRAHVPFAIEDRIFADDVERIAELLSSGELLAAVYGRVGELEC